MTSQLPTHPAEATLDRSDDRWVLRMERTLHHPAERVWAALTRRRDTPLGFRMLPTATSMSLVWCHCHKLKAVKRLKAARARGGTRGRATRLLAMNWGGHELRFEIAPVPTGVRLSLTHMHSM